MEMKNFIVKCKKCGSEDIELSYREEYPEPDTMIWGTLTCNNCGNKEDS